MPEDAVYMGRPSIYGNPYNWKTADPGIGPEIWRKGAAVDLFRMWIQNSSQAYLLARARKELKGKKGACWCRLEDPCHVDIWLQLINEEDGSENDRHRS